MVDSDYELKQQVDEFTGTQLSTSQLNLVVERAKRKIRAEKDLTTTAPDWYNEFYAEEALFWWSCLFAKVSAGDLDAGTFETGSITEVHLASSDAGEWFRNAKKAMTNMGAKDGGGVAIGGPEREDRVYGDDDNTGETGDIL